ncbi:hypothetical protein C6Q09_19465 [Burkholderia multivorans]|nr:hypothetical protein C6Q09_19465 [Burkholderia multivorans]
MVFTCFELKGLKNIFKFFYSEVVLKPISVVDVVCLDFVVSVFSSSVFKIFSCLVVYFKKKLNLV